MASLARCVVDVDKLTTAVSGLFADQAASVLSALGVQRLSDLEKTKESHMTNPLEPHHHAIYIHRIEAEKLAEERRISKYKEADDFYKNELIFFRNKYAPMCEKIGHIWSREKAIFDEFFGAKMPATERRRRCIICDARKIIEDPEHESCHFGKA